MISWIYRLIGKKVSTKLGLQEDSKMDTKTWYKSKTIWTAILTAVIGAIQPVSTAFGHPVVIPQWVLEVLIGMGLYSLRVGDKTIQ